MARTVMRFGTISRSGISRRRGPRASSFGPLGSKGGKGVFISRSRLWSTASACRRSLAGAEFRNDGFTGNRCLAKRHPRLGAGGKENVQPRAETNETDAFACLDWLVRLHE